ncbi:MAG: alpha-glucosidase/alpha-galactosidase [Elusimicrobia bacterium RIFOXYA2_FULL_39_19]|nr:MAG: alpha-glucosidase/alpha-galactosidase [Elusimicrobia bacterium RIFOXYA2_FULL_39_19]
MKKYSERKKITFMGAGSTIFARNILGDCMLSEPLKDAEIALYDIDSVRLKESKNLLDRTNGQVNNNRSKISAYLGVKERKEALRGSNFVVNAIQAGGYKPSTVIDFEIPKKYGLRQTIADTLGIGGIFRALRTIPVVLDFARDMEKCCPEAWFLNYVNPMAMITAGLLRGSEIKTVGLCHSWPGTDELLIEVLGMDKEVKNLKSKIAGINHQAWLLEMKDGEKDLYPEIYRRAKKYVADGRKNTKNKPRELVRLEIMLNFGYFVTESSEHNAEYTPWFIKKSHPELIKQYNIPIDEYLRRCASQIKGWKKESGNLMDDKSPHRRSHEYASYIMEAIQTNVPYKFGGNVMNDGIITNLPSKACVEVPCIADYNGINPVLVGDLPQQCAALNRTNINVQILTVEAALTRKKDFIYQAALLDPHTAAELTIDEIRNMCDDLIKAHGNYLPKYK